MKTLLYFKNRIQTAVKPINVGLTAVFIFLTVKDGIIIKKKNAGNQKIRKNLHFLKRLAEGVKKGYNKGHDMDTALTGGICRKVSGEMPGADSTDRKTYEESRSCRKF